MRLVLNLFTFVDQKGCSLVDFPIVFPDSRKKFYEVCRHLELLSFQGMREVFSCEFSPKKMAEKNWS